VHQRGGEGRGGAEAPSLSLAPPRAWPRPPYRDERLPSSRCLAASLTAAGLAADCSFMPRNAVVTMRYGPYSAAGLSVEHRTFRLEGLQGGSPCSVTICVPQLRYPCSLKRLPRPSSFLSPQPRATSSRKSSKSQTPQGDLVSSPAWL
jgi:hypothetical protein